MDIKKVLIIGAVIAGAYWLYQRSKKSETPAETTGETSSANGAQLLAVAKANRR